MHLGRDKYKNSKIQSGLQRNKRDTVINIQIQEYNAQLICVFKPIGCLAYKFATDDLQMKK